MDLGAGWVTVIKHKADHNMVLVSRAWRAQYSQPFSRDWETLCRDDRSMGRYNTMQGYYDDVLNCEKHILAEAHAEPLVLVLPILSIHAECLLRGFKIHYLRIRYGMKDGAVIFSSVRARALRTVEASWGLIREAKHDALMPLECIQNYDSDYNAGKLQKSQEYKNLDKRLRCIENEISRTESLARDYIQHRVAILSLQESRASIKQAKVALEESRRTKLVAILAIFFVPISLSTSIFGMNIAELNQSGQSIWVFILTTVLVVSATMVIWGSMYQFQKWTSLPRKKSTWGERHPRKARFLSFCRLIYHGHILWAWKSGIVFSLWTNGRVGFLRSCFQHRRQGGHSRYHPQRFLSDHLGRKVLRKESNDEQIDELSNLVETSKGDLLHV
ncbi:hypothetical protein F5Y17DRAFT_279241 [Xylariaceae sp. FL0594]|nr:hypothetical protein F5Y17DRAFT_279241 [Xylariaceae sp. FL0594]